jgi:hypothetical protein
MDCKTAMRALLDSEAGMGNRDEARGEAAAREVLAGHVRGCLECTRRLEEHQRIRRALGSLPRPAAPVELSWKLRSAAARELSLARRTASSGSRWGNWLSRQRLAFRNEMRPLALPFAGGVCSAVLLFSMVLPTFTLARGTSPDVPTNLSTPASVRSMPPLGFGAGEAVVDLTVDGNGRIVDYAIVSEDGASKDTLRRSIENTLLFTTFNPGTSFGQPTYGRIRLTFRSSRIEVRG